MPIGAWGQAAAGLALVVGATLAGTGTAHADDVPTLPASPKVGVPETGPAGLVRIPVSGTAGTTVQVRDGATVVASTYAGGGVQWIELAAPTGRHTYDVSATDASGVASRSTTVRVDADATPPAARRVRVARATPADARTRLSLTTDPGTSYSFTVDGLPVADGTTRDGALDLAMALADGSHVLSLGLTDPAGNQRFVDRTVQVAVPRLKVHAEPTGTPRDTTQTVAVTGTPGARAVVTIAGAGTRRVVLGDGGTARATFDLDDGTHPGARVRLTDETGRRGSTRLAAFTVDTAAPRLAVEDLGGQEAWSGRVAAEAGSDVVWQLRDGSGDAVADGTFTADAEAGRLEATGLEEGGYDLTVTATDAVGNTTTKDLPVTVAATPLSAGDVVAGAGSVLVLVIGLGLCSLVVSAQREKVAARREREALREAAASDARERDETARRRAEEATAYHDRLVDYEHAALLHRQDLGVWDQRRAHLADLLQRARLDRGIRPAGFTAFKLRAWEQVYCTVPGSMVEVRQRQGSSHVTVVDDGDVTVTSDRVVFAGYKRREWSLAQLEAMEHMGADRTMMKVSSRKTWSGVTYGDPAHTRLCIALAAAEHAGTRDEVVAAAERALEAHEAERPVAPEHPGPPPAGSQPLTPSVAPTPADHPQESRLV
jgi:hypothetical protein